MNRRVVQIFIEKAIKGEIIDVQGADERLTLPTLGMLLAVSLKRPQIQMPLGKYSNNNGNSRSLLELADCIKTHFPQVKINVSERDNFRPDEPLSTEKARLKIGYQPTYTLEEGINEYVEFLTNIKNYQ